MKKFVIFYNEKEGTSALLRLLDNFPNVTVVRQGNEWESFDRHAYGNMSSKNLMKCLDLAFNNDDDFIEALNSIYTKTAKAPISDFNKSLLYGVKMRFQPPPIRYSIKRTWQDPSRFKKILDNRREKSFQHQIFKILKNNNVAAFVAVRKDKLRWALSMAHGDGSGNPGHLQFRLANGSLKREDIEKHEFDCDLLERILKKCDRLYKKKKNLIENLENADIPICRIFYEDFLNDKHTFFRRFFDHLGTSVSKEEIDTALSKGAYYEKVHSHNLSEFVENHKEVIDRFGDIESSW